MEGSNAMLVGYTFGRSIYFNEARKRFKFGSFWVHKGRLVGAFLEGGEKKDFRLLQRVVEKRVLVQEIEQEYMQKRGLSWAREAYIRVSDAEVYPGYDSTTPKQNILTGIVASFLGNGKLQQADIDDEADYEEADLYEEDVDPEAFVHNANFTFSSMNSH